MTNRNQSSMAACSSSKKPFMPSGRVEKRFASPLSFRQAGQPTRENKLSDLAGLFATSPVQQHSDLVILCGKYKSIKFLARRSGDPDPGYIRSWTIRPHDPGHGHGRQQPRLSRLPGDSRMHTCHELLLLFIRPPSTTFVSFVSRSFTANVSETRLLIVTWRNCWLRRSRIKCALSVLE
jgi:hypothetical protein